MTDEEKREYSRRYYAEHREKIRERQREKNVSNKYKRLLEALEAFEDYNRNYNALYLDTEYYEFDIDKITNPKRPYRDLEANHIDVDYGIDDSTRIGVTEE